MKFKVFIQKTFGGLNKNYLIRQYLFGLIILIFSIVTYPVSSKNYSFYLFFFIAWALYPYARFVYESIVNYILGDNIIFSNIILFLFVKIITMFLCFAFSIFIAPIGLIYLYFVNSKAEQS